MKNRTFPFFLFTLAVTFLFGLCFTSADFVSSPVATAGDIITLTLQWMVVVVAMFGLFLMMASNRYVFAVALPLVSVLSAALAYFRYTANTSLTAAIWEAALNNDAVTSAELLTPALFIYAGVALAAALAMVYIRFKYIRPRRAWLWAAAGLALMMGMNLVERFQRPISERIPFNVYYTWRAYQENKEVVETERPYMTEGLECRGDSITVVLVIGESLRPDHLGINGYERNTTPRLESEDVLSFPYMYSEQTYTNRSIPHLLTRADSSDYGRAYREPSFIHLLNACGYASSWLANQETADTYAYFTQECDTVIRVNIGKSPYVFDKWLDGDLMPAFRAMLNSSEAAKQLIILHTIGSHWWYNSHYPDSAEMFKPVARSRIISSNTQEEMINSYDNTVLYTDFFLSQLIDSLRNRKAILIYQSDHGEALGEDGRWLHAAETPETHEAACFIWLSPAYKAAFPEMYANAEANRPNHYRTDCLFHTVLDAARIGSPYLQPSLSLFRKR
jgi:glucan phosphoethanolaminetransferase (alkaline phosphatase superfamily)